MGRIYNVDKYIEGCERMNAIRAYCKEHEIYDYSTLMDIAMTEKPEWVHTLQGYGAIKAMRLYFRSACRERDHKKAMENAGPNRRIAKVIVCTDNGMEFKSINAATKWVGIKRSHEIADCCRGVIDNVHGYHFRFKEDLETEASDERETD